MLYMMGCRMYCGVMVGKTFRIAVAVNELITRILFRIIIQMPISIIDIRVKVFANVKLFDAMTVVMDVSVMFDTQCVEIMLIIADQLNNLEANEFGMLLNNEKHADIKEELFAKPHHDILTDAHPVLSSLMMSAQIYRERFHRVAALPEQQIEMLLSFHPQKELVVDPL